jgi:hypothetical protein
VPFLALLLAAATVVSPRPDSVAVTVYRDPERTQGEMFNLGWLNGFALVTETRTVELPAGEAELRFEGVAGGIVPVSAVVTGLPGGVVQKNRDARLLSPAALVDGSLGRRVTIRRTNPATGAVREEDAIVRSGPDGGVVLQTQTGVEALRCSGLPEKLVHDRVPPGLSARPTLSVTTRSPSAVRATVTLSYLASEFDWSASYVARIAPDGRTLDLFAWLTLANGNDESFPQAETQAVAGTLNRVSQFDPWEPAGGSLYLQCYPLGTTADTPVIPEEGAGGGDEIVVTGSRLMLRAPAPPPPAAMMEAPAMMAQQEELGDLKLYHVPERVTVAAHSQKQVALLSQTAIPFDRIYRFTSFGEQPLPSMEAVIVYRMRNLAARGLGLPLPSGAVALLQTRAGAERLVGQGRMRDAAIGEEVDLAAGRSAQVRLLREQIFDAAGNMVGLKLTASNANPVPVRAETRLDPAAEPIDAAAPVVHKDGAPVWIATVPANGTASFTYRFAPPKRGGDDSARPAQRR